MGQSSLKNNRRALRRTAQEEKNNIVSRYMTDNWDKVLVSSVSIIRQFKFKNRFQIAMTIIFKPIKKDKKAPDPKEPRPDVKPPPQKPEMSGAGPDGKDSGGENGSAEQ
jgi:hypothetical protein